MSSESEHLEEMLLWANRTRQLIDYIKELAPICSVRYGIRENLPHLKEWDDELKEVLK